MANGKFESGDGRARRPKGVPNKATMNAREAIAAFVDGNAHRLEHWLDRIAENDPKDAFNCFQSVIEYHIPKLARTEMTGKDGGAIETKDITKSDAEVLAHYFKIRGLKDDGSNK